MNDRKTIEQSVRESLEAYFEDLGDVEPSPVTGELYLPELIPLARADDRPVATLEVEDDGTGIPEAMRVEIFGRGARLDTVKPGTGLGLAIVRDVAEIYGGTVELGESEDLGGLLVTLKLPRAG